jgi:hypothetical protein
MPDLTELSAREYAETMHPGWGTWRERDRFYLYTHASARFLVIHETHTEHGFGYDRVEAMQEKGISLNHDGNVFAHDFVQLFCEHLNLRDLEGLICALAIHHRDRLAEHAAIRSREGGIKGWLKRLWENL